MNWLAIDTSMNACGVAVRLDDGREFKTIEHMIRGQSERLMPMIQDVVAQAELTLTEIDAFAVSNGPGTFTGLRIGLSVARTLGLVSGKPVMGISTFDALYATAGIKNKTVCVLIETKRSDYYCQIYDQTGGVIIDATCMTANDLKNIVQGDWVIIGDAGERFQKETSLPNETHHIACPNPECMIDLAMPHIGTISGMPEPVYLRGADVSVSRQKTATIV